MCFVLIVNFCATSRRKSFLGAQEGIVAMLRKLLLIAGAWAFCSAANAGKHHDIFLVRELVSRVLGAEFSHFVISLQVVISTVIRTVVLVLRANLAYTLAVAGQMATALPKQQAMLGLTENFNVQAARPWNRKPSWGSRIPSPMLSGEILRI